MNRRVAIFGCCLFLSLSALAQTIVITNNTLVATWSDSFGRAQYGQRQNFFIGSYFINYYPQYFVSYIDHSRSGASNLEMVQERYPEYGIPEDAICMSGGTNVLNIFYASGNGQFTQAAMQTNAEQLFQAPSNTYTVGGYMTNDFIMPLSTWTNYYQSLAMHDCVYWALHGVNGSELLYNAGFSTAAGEYGVPVITSFNNLSNTFAPLYPAGSNYWFNPPNYDHPGNEEDAGWALTTFTNMQVDSNTFTCVIDMRAVTTSSTYHCSVSGLIRTGNTITFSLLADRMAPVLYVPDGTTTNDMRGIFALMPQLKNTFCEMLSLTNMYDGVYTITMDGNYTFTARAVDGRLDINFWNDYTNAFHKQAMTILYLMCDKQDISRTDQSSDAHVGTNLGNEDYESYARTRWATNTLGNTAYIASMRDKWGPMLSGFDIPVHNAAQQTNPTFSISLPPPRLAPVLR